MVGACPVFLTIPQNGKLTTRQVPIADSVRGSRALTDCFGAHAPFSFKKQELSVPHRGIVTIASDGGQSDEFTLNDPLPEETVQRSIPAGRHQRYQKISDTRKYPKCDDVRIVACKQEEPFMPRDIEINGHKFPDNHIHFANDASYSTSNKGPLNKETSIETTLELCGGIDQ
jgi:hypothetical protein